MFSELTVSLLRVSVTDALLEVEEPQHVSVEEGIGIRLLGLL